MGIKTACAGLAVGLSLAAQTPIGVRVLNQTNTNAGLNGRLQSFMSTGFQPAEWDSAFFNNIPGAAGLLWELAPQHIRLQPISQAVLLEAFPPEDRVPVELQHAQRHSPSRAQRRGS